MGYVHCRAGREKSPVLNEIKRLIEDHETIARDKYEKDRYVYNVERERFDKDYKKGMVGIESMPVAPKSGSILIGKSTIEAIFDRIANNTRGVLMMRDELGGLVQGLNQYKKGKGDDLDSLLELYDGCNIAVDTKTAGGAYIRDCTCSVFGGTQPKRFESLFYTEENVSSGFFARFIPLWIPEADTISIGKPIDAKAKKDMLDTVNILWLLEKTEYQVNDKVLYRPGKVMLDNTALALFLAEENFYQKMKKNAATEAVKRVLSKVASRTAKIALIFMLVELADILRVKPAEDNKKLMNKHDLCLVENWMKAAVRVNFWFVMTVYRWMTDSPEYNAGVNKIKGLETEIILALKSGDVTKRDMTRKYKSAAGKRALQNLLDNHGVASIKKAGLTSRGERFTEYYTLVTS